jgi:hypothetical protein
MAGPWTADPWVGVSFPGAAADCSVMATLAMPRGFLGTVNHVFRAKSARSGRNRLFFERKMKSRAPLRQHALLDGRAQLVHVPLLGAGLGGLVKILVQKVVIFWGGSLPGSWSRIRHNKSTWLCPKADSNLVTIDAAAHKAHQINCHQAQPASPCCSNPISSPPAGRPGGT